MEVMETCALWLRFLLSFSSYSSAKLCFGQSSTVWSWLLGEKGSGVSLQSPSQHKTLSVQPRKLPLVLLFSLLK